MKIKNSTYLFFLIFFFGSCVAKKTTVEYKERIVKDTIRIERIKTVIKPVKEFITVNNPCDSLGVLKDFERVFKTEKVKVKVYNDNGKLAVKINIDSIINSKEKEFKSKYHSKNDTKTVNIVRYKYPLWLILTSVISILLNLLLLKNKLF